MGTNQKGRPNPELPLLRDETVIEAPVEQSTITARYTEEAVKFIEANQEQSFFLYLPHEAYYYYQMEQLRAVRSGQWKLFVELSPKKRNWGKPEGNTELKLFNLVTDIHEDNNVAQQNPQIVEQLLVFANQAREDLGDTGRPGRNQREAGWVAEAHPLQLNP